MVPMIRPDTGLRIQKARQAEARRAGWVARGADQSGSTGQMIGTTSVELPLESAALYGQINEE